MSRPFDLFAPTPTDRRTLLLPTALPDAERTALITRLQAAVQRQQELAANCDAVLPIHDVHVENDRITVLHERVAPLIWSAATDRDPNSLPDLDTLLWLNWHAVRTLQTATDAKIVHGGLLPGALALDALGLVRVTDFGIAPAFVSTLGAERAQRLHLQSDPTVLGTEEGGRWELLDERRQAAFGYVASVRAHELQQGTRSNPKSDQFALAVSLLWLASGRHPFDIDPADPTAMYFQIDPASPADERTTWAAALERHENGLGSDDDRRLAEWIRIARQAATSDPETRFAQPTDWQTALEALISTDWSATTTALRSADKLLDVGDAEGFLEQANPLATEKALPEVFREAITPLVAQVESQKATIIRRRQLDRELHTAREQLDLVEVEAARRHARLVSEDDEATVEQREAAFALLEECSEQERFMLSGADEVASTFIQAAREAFKRREWSDAKEVLHGVVGDKATPPTRARQAQALAAEIELAEQRYSAQASALRTAHENFAAREFAAARLALEALLEEAHLDEKIRPQVGPLLAEVTDAIAERDAICSALDDAEEQWEQADASALRETLGAVSADYPEPELMDRRAQIEVLLGHLERAHDLVAEAANRLAKEDAEGAQEHAEQARSIDPLPAIVRARVDELLQQSEEQIERQRRELQADVEAAIAEAREVFARGETDRARHLLAERVTERAKVPDALRAAGAKLADACDNVDRVNAALDEAAAVGERGSIREALTAAEAIDTSGLPAVTVERRDAVLTDLQRRLADYVAERVSEARRLLEQARAALDEGAVGQAEAQLAELANVPDTPVEIDAEARQLSESCTAARALLVKLEEAERFARKDPGEVERILAALPGPLADWATERVDALRASIAAERDRRRTARLQRVTQSLESIEAALTSPELNVRSLADAQALLAELEEETDVEPPVAERIDDAARGLANAKEWLDRISTLEGQLEQEEFLSVSESARSAQTEPAPAFVGPRLATIHESARQGIARCRSVLDDELRELTEQLTARSHRGRRFPTKLDRLRTDPYLTPEQGTQIDALRQQHDALPAARPRTGRWLAIGGGVAAALALPVGYALWSQARPDAPPPSPSDPNASIVDQTTTQPSIAVVAPDSDPKLETSPADDEPRLATKSPAKTPTTNRVPPSTDPPRRERETPTPPTIAQRMQAALDSARSSLTAYRDQLPERQREPDYTLTFEPSTRLPAALVAVGSGGNRTQLATVETMEALDDLTFQPEWGGRLFPEPVPTFAEALERYRSALQSASAPDVTITAEAMNGDAAAVRAVWNGIALSPMEPVQFDPATGALQPTAEQIADTFVQQVLRLQAARAGRFTWSIDPVYDAQLEWLKEPTIATPALQAEARIPIRGTMRFAADSRSGVSFAVRGTVIDDRMVLESTTLDAFRHYLTTLQLDRAERRAADARATLPRSTIFTVEPEVVDESDPSVLTLRIAHGEQVIVESAATWDATTLDFPLDAAPLRAATLSALNERLQQSATRDALEQQWPAVRDSIAPAPSAVGSALFASAQATIESVGELDPEQLAATVQLRVRMPAFPDTPVTLDIPITLGNDGWRFTPDTETARQALAAWLAKLDDAPLRNQRARATAAALATDLAVPALRLRSAVRGETLMVDVDANTTRARRFQWQWDPTTLDFRARREVTAPKPKPSITPQRPQTPRPPTTASLAQLAQRPSLDASELAAGLAAVSTGKVARFGNANYRTLATTGDARQQLVAVSQHLIDNLAPNPANDPIPTVFVEYAEENGQIYGIRWRAVVRDGRVTDVSGYRIWPALSADLARGAAGPLRKRLRNDQRLGEQLLGRAIGSDGLPVADGSFGIVIAPEGPLWWVRWEQIAIEARSTRGIQRNGTRIPDRADYLRDVLVRDGEKRRVRRPRVGIWCVPTLAGGVRGVPAGQRLSTGGGGRPLTLRFEKYPHVTFATIEDTSGVGDFGYPLFCSEARPETIGLDFWTRGWDRDRWRPTPNVGFVLLPQINE